MGLSSYGLLDGVVWYNEVGVNGWMDGWMDGELKVHAAEIFFYTFYSY